MQSKRSELLWHQYLVECSLKTFNPEDLPKLKPLFLENLHNGRSPKVLSRSTFFKQFEELSYAYSYDFGVMLRRLSTLFNNGGNSHTILLAASQYFVKQTSDPILQLCLQGWDFQTARETISNL